MKKPKWEATSIYQRIRILVAYRQAETQKVSQLQQEGKGFYEKRKGVITRKEEGIPTGINKLSHSRLYTVGYWFHLLSESPQSLVCETAVVGTSPKV